MKKVIWFASLMPLLASGQVVYDFESGTPPGWIQCPVNQWIADSYQPLDGVYSFHHVYDDPEAGSAMAGFRTDNLKPSLGNVRWSFKIKHGYDPSASNNWSFFLMGDAEPCQMIPGSSINGFAIGVNLSGYDDTLRLWKVKGGNIYPLLSTGINWQSIIGTQNFATLEAERSPEGIWRIGIYDFNGNILSLKVTADSELFEALWCGISYKYTSTRDRLLWIDDIRIDGVFREDREAPVVKSVITTSRNSVEVKLDEEPDTGFSDPSNFSVNSIENAAVSVVRKAGSIFEIKFSEYLINKSVNHLTIKVLCDKHSNCVQNTVSSFSVAWAEPGDMVITEIMADPLPVVGLPPAEYLEILNCSEFSFNLSGWTLRTEDKVAEFQDHLVLPGRYVVICSPDDTALLSDYSDVTCLRSFPALTDHGRMIALFDATGEFIYGAEYSVRWYGSSLKEGGGWSLEMIDTRYPFHGQGNWTASRSPAGGTPGMENSVKGACIDDTFEGITNLFPTDSVTLLLKLSEPLKNDAADLSDLIQSDLQIESVTDNGIMKKEFIIKLSEPVISGPVYTFELPEMVSDYAGNRISYRSHSFGIPTLISGKDILFNEILFNPFPGDPDYIELFNNSSKILDLSELYLASVSITSADTSGLSPVSTEKRCFLPGEYYAVTTEKDKVVSRYFSSDVRRIFEMQALPSMPDDKGNIVLLSKHLSVVDAVIYEEDMHYPLLSGTEGIALEKIRTGIFSGNRSSWHSASENSGWGTPGAPNSLLSEKGDTIPSVVMSSTRITPDNDGIEDVLIIDLSFPEAGNVVSVSIFDESGSYIGKPADNIFANMNATVVWDGRSDDGSLVRRGIYVIMIKVHDEKGRVSSLKRACTVIR